MSYFWGFLPAFFLAGPAMAATPILHCEFLLTDALVEPAHAWLRAHFSKIRRTARVQKEYGPTELALQSLGMPAVLTKDIEMKLDTRQAHEGLYWLRLKNPRGRELRAFPLHVPPVIVWKKANIGETYSMFDWSLETEREIDLSFGTVMSDGDKRTFIAVTKAGRSYLSVTVGLDVDCGQYSQYSKAAGLQFVLPSDGDPDDHLCRIGVIRADFPF